MTITQNSRNIFVTLSETMLFNACGEGGFLKLLIPSTLESPLYYTYKWKDGVFIFTGIEKEFLSLS